MRENLSINQRPVVDKDVKSAAPAKDPSTTREEHPPCQGWEGALREGCQRAGFAHWHQPFPSFADQTCSVLVEERGASLLSDRVRRA